MEQLLPTESVSSRAGGRCGGRPAVEARIRIQGACALVSVVLSRPHRYGTVLGTIDTRADQAAENCSLAHTSLLGQSSVALCERWTPKGAHAHSCSTCQG